MGYETSFTKIENELTPGLRNSLNSAESHTDVQKIFGEFVQEFFSRITGAAVVLDEGDVRVDPEAEDGYVLGPGITLNAEFSKFLGQSDLLDILRRQAEQASNKFKYMTKHPQHTETAPFPRKDRKPLVPRR